MINSLLKQNKIVLIIIFLSILYLIKSVITYGTYVPNDRIKLEILLKDESISLENIDIRKIDNLSRLFYLYPRKDYSGIEKWDVSPVKDMSEMFKNTGMFYGGISNWDVSNVENMMFMFAYTDDISKKQVNNWKVSDDVKYYGMFRGTELEKNPPEWFRLKNEFEIDNVTEALDNIKRYNKSYLQEYHRLLSIKKGIDMEISKDKFFGNSYIGSSKSYIEYLEGISSEYHDKLIDISMQPFYEKLENPKKLIHDDYPGIEFWNVPNLYELLNKIYE